MAKTFPRGSFSAFASNAELPQILWNCGKCLSTGRDQIRMEINSEGFPCGSISSLGALGEGSGWDLRVCPAPALAASGNLGFCPPRDRGRKTGFSNGLAHNRSKVSGSWAEIDGVHINFSKSTFHVCQKNMRVAESGDLKSESCSQIWDFSNHMFSGNLKHQERAFSILFYAGI